MLSRIIYVKDESYVYSCTLEVLDAPMLLRNVNTKYLANYRKYLINAFDMLPEEYRGDFLKEKYILSINHQLKYCQNI